MIGQVVVVAPEGAFGAALVERLIARGKPPLLLLDNPSEAVERFPKAAGSVRFNGLTTGPWVDALDGASVVYSLAGARARMGEPAHALAQRRRMAGRLLEDAVSGVRVAPRVLVGASSVRAVLPVARSPARSALDEQAPRTDTEAARALGELERGIRAATQRGTRSIVVRLGAILEREDGILPPLAHRFLSHRGGALRPRDASLPWIHVADALELLQFAADPEVRAEGILHAVAPEAVTSAQLATGVGHRLHRAAWLPLSRRAARRVFGEETVALFVRAPPVTSRAEHLGYGFQHPTLDSALDALLGTAAPSHASESAQAHPT